MPVLHCLCIGLIATECRGEVFVRIRTYTGHVKNCVDVPIGILFERLYIVSTEILHHLTMQNVAYICNLVFMDCVWCKPERASH